MVRAKEWENRGVGRGKDHLKGGRRGREKMVVLVGERKGKAQAKKIRGGI